MQYRNKIRYSKNVSEVFRIKYSKKLDEFKSSTVEGITYILWDRNYFYGFK